MIDTALWKRAIQRFACQLEGYCGKKNVSHVSSARLERLVMQSFYLLHKLIDDHRIDDHLAETEVSVRTIRSEGMRYYLNNPKHALSQVNEASPTKIRLGVITNKIIHSYLILPLTSPQQGLREIVVCSEFEHYDQLIVVSLDHLLSALKLEQ